MDDWKAVSQHLVQHWLLELHEAQEIWMLDQLIGAYHKRVTLDARYMPQNFEEERARFVQHQGVYTPTFSYKKFPLERWYETIEEIKRISSLIQQKSWRSRCVPLYYDKVRELYTQVQTLVAWEEKRDADMRQSLLMLFPVCSEDVWKECEMQVRSFFAETEESMRSVDTMKSVETADAAEHMESKTRHTWYEWKAYTEEALKHAWLSHVPVVIKQVGYGARCYVQYTPILRLVLHVPGRISEVRAQAATAHEISHLRRWQAGCQRWLQLFQWWTAGVLPQEEWWAIAAAMEYRQQAWRAAEWLLPSQLLLCATQAAHTLWFLEVCAYLHALTWWKLTYEKLFTLVARAKRGVSDVSRGGAYPKWSLYRLWYQEFLSVRWDDSWREKFCTYGKVKRSDSDLLEPLL